jgi:hypothetical protein
MVRKAKQKFWGVIDYQPRWGLTIRGWLIVLLGSILAIALMGLKLETFLAYNRPVTADVLVVEGWVGDGSIEGAIVEFARGKYQLLITTGIPLGRGKYLTEYKNFAKLSEATLITLGFDPAKIQAIPTPNVERDRTLASAIAVETWLESSTLQVDAINIYTDDVHARRSWMLYKKVFEPEIAVGAIAHPAVDYDPQFWWASSEGFRKVFSEGIAYIYAKFL